jgi:hypothetical protein
MQSQSSLKVQLFIECANVANVISNSTVKLIQGIPFRLCKADLNIVFDIAVIFMQFPKEVSDRSINK